MLYCRPYMYKQILNIYLPSIRQNQKCSKNMKNEDLLVNPCRNHPLGFSLIHFK